MKKTAFSARSISPERALMIIRIGIGLTFVIHGYSKLQGGPEQWQWLGQQLQLVGIDLFPVFWGLMATITEFLGGILLLVGLATRLASLFLFFTMAIAFLHKAVIGEGFGEVAYPLSQLILFLSLFLTDSKNQVLFKNQKKTMNRKEFLNRSSLALGGLMAGPNIIYNKTKTKKMNELKITDPDLENICITCGTRYSANVYDKERCLICLDERQYVKFFGQKWTSYSKLERDHAIQVNQIRNDMYELRITPSFAISQRALLVTSTKGIVLWDCIPLLGKPTFEFVKCPIYLHSADKEWVMDKNQNILYWDSETKKNLLPGIDIVHTGGHFPGSTVLHLHHTIKNSILVGDTLYLSRDKKHLSAMFSYPNIIPLGKKELFSVFQSLEKLNFDCLYGAFQRQNLESGAKSVFKNSFEVYNKIYGNG